MYPPPEISSYSMLVRISSPDGARLAEGLCDIGYSTENSLFVDADELWRSCLPILVAQSFRVSVALLRKADGKLLHIASHLIPESSFGSTEYANDCVTLECQGPVNCSTKSKLYPLHVADSKERLEEIISEPWTVANRDQRDWLEHDLELVGCQYTTDSTGQMKLQAVEDFAVAVWENDESGDRIPCSRLLACYAVSKDWV